MRVVYYTYPHFFELAVMLSRAISLRADFHLLLELSPSSWERAMFDMTRVALCAGVQPASSTIGHHFAPQISEYWRNVSSFNLVVHTSQKSIHPASWWTSRLAMRFIRDLKPDLLHLDDPDMSVRLALNNVELRKLPLILNVHDPSPHSGEFSWRKTLARRLIFPRVNRFILHNENQVETFCRENGIAPDRVSVVRLGSYEVYREWISRAIKQGGRTVLFFGRLSPYKGVEVLYDAAKRVAERIPNVRFVVAGRSESKYRPPDPPSLPRGGSIVLIPRYIGNAHLAELFEQATVVVCPYLDATQSGVILTAYAFNRPVIATTVGGLPEYVVQNETGILVPPDNSRALGDALIELLLNPDLRTQLQNRIRSLKDDRFSWRRVADETVAVYENVMSSR